MWSSVLRGALLDPTRVKSVSVMEASVQIHQRMTLIDALFCKTAINEPFRAFVHEIVAKPCSQLHVPPQSYVVEVGTCSFLFQYR